MKNILRYAVFLLIFSFLAFSCSSAKSSKSSDRQDNIDTEAPLEEPEEEIEIELPPEERELPVSSFHEIWAYVVAGREAAFRPSLPISDIGYFGAEVNSFGALVDVPKRRALAAFKGRVHLVVACGGRALSHFALYPGRPERQALIADLLKASADFDGLQIDFEDVSQRDGAAYVSFLAELRAGLGDKMFTVALRARTRKIENDTYDYETIKPLVDRILVMAYDEHWSGSSPGSIASLAWCKRVADYSLKTIGPEKLIMGLPFYGRAWGNANPSRALIYSTIASIVKEYEVSDMQRENGIPVFKYVIPVSTTVYYEDAYSLSVRMEMYKAQGVNAIGFWRLGQETPAVWRILVLD